MYPYLRLTRVLITKRFQSKLDFYSRDSDTISMMVWPQDIDPFLELNNGRYVTLLDLGRYGYGTRVDINGFLKKNQWSLTITGTYNEYRHRLRLFQKFELNTKIIGYDSDWFYFFQKIERNGKTHMASVVKYAFTSKKGIVKPKEVVAAMGEKYDPSQLPKWVTEIGQHQVFKK
ncbi:MAG: thioesterase family protein [Crocinitomicaceae bacterium]|tara:strand:+ start:984 stop:1505 length:522 start_codon:yes stop_codon:yes gene_type:complete